MILRAIACDLDGTLLRSDGTLGERTRVVLDGCQAAGALVILCTARPVRWVRPLAAQLSGRPLAACDNGAVRWDPVQEELLGLTAFAADAARAVLRAVSAALPGGAWALERADGFAHEPGYRPHWPVPPGTPVDRIESLLAEPAVKLMFRHPAFGADEMLARAQEAVGPRAELTHSNSAGDLLEISPVGVSKAAALAELCAARGIAAEAVIAFGDMPNDLKMLRWAGRSVAVAGAHPEVIAVAHEVTLSNDEQGVARVLERALAADRFGLLS